MRSGLRHKAWFVTTSITLLLFFFFKRHCFNRVDYCLFYGMHVICSMDCKAKLLENLYTCFSDGGSFDNVRVNLGIDISRKAGEVPVAALNMKSEVDGAMEQDKSNTSSQLCRKRYFKMFALKMMPKGHQSISLHDEKDLTFIGIVKVICFGEHYNSNW